MSKRGWEKAVDEAIRRLGSRGALAKRLGITRQAILLWPKRGPKAEHVKILEELSGVPRHEIRPDIYDPPDRERSRSTQVRAA